MTDSTTIEIPNNHVNLPRKEARLSFNNDNGSREVLVSGSVLKRQSTLLRRKTKSRLTTHEPEIGEKLSQNIPKSGTPEKGHGEIKEDECFIDDDMPQEYKRLRYNKWTLLQLTSLILNIAALASTLAIPNYRNKKLYDLQWWKWEVMLIIVISGRLVSGWGIRIIVFFLERSFLLRKRVLYFVYGLKQAVQNCIWLTLILIAWECIFSKKIERMTHGKKVLPYITKIWICLLVGTVVWLLKTLLIKVLALNFHVNKFFDRIQDSLFNQYVIEKLSLLPQQEQDQEEEVIEGVPKLQRVGASLPTQLKGDIFKGFRGIGTHTSGTAVSEKSDNRITIDHLHRLNQKNISAWNMKKMMNGIKTSMLTSIIEESQDVISTKDDFSLQITCEEKAKVAAKKIFCRVADPGSKHIYLENLMRCLQDDEALKTIRLIDDASETKGISKRTFKNWVVNVFLERKALALSLNDTKSAVEKLHQMFNVVIGIIIILIWILILKIATSQFFIFLSSQLVLVAFVFGNTCKTMFEAIIFLFVVHPFDVGDRCEIDGVQMVVEEMHILTTIFLRYDNQKIAYPNSVLSNLPIANFQRSPDMGDAIDFCIHISTPTVKIAKMKKKIIGYIERKSNHWQPKPMIVLRDVEDLNRLNISIWLLHRMNFQDMGERWKRRARLVEEMIMILKDLDIEYRMLPLDINARNIPGLASNPFPSNWSACAN